MTTRPGIGGITFTAHLQCSRCPTLGDLPMRGGIDPPEIDRRFINHGWKVDPHLCPSCVTKPKDKPMAAAQSLAAAKATIKMHDLLTAHFDTKDGRYVTGWTDEKIAKETGLAITMVGEYRISEFGEIREPTEVQLIRSDITALEAMARDNQAALSAEIANLRTRLAGLTQKLGLAA